LKFDATPLFPERIATTVPYKLSDAEARCESAWGPDADRHAKILIIIRFQGSNFECAGRPAKSRWCKSTTMKE
jgi:hypothetical protein